MARAVLQQAVVGVLLIEKSVRHAHGVTEKQIIPRCCALLTFGFALCAVEGDFCAGSGSATPVPPSSSASPAAVIPSTCAVASSVGSIAATSSITGESVVAASSAMATVNESETRQDDLKSCIRLSASVQSASQADTERSEHLQCDVIVELNIESITACIPTLYQTEAAPRPLNGTMGKHGKAGKEIVAAGVDNTSRRKWDGDEFAKKAADREEKVCL